MILVTLFLTMENKRQFYLKKVTLQHKRPIPDLHKSNQGESEVGSTDRFDWIEGRDMQTHPDQCETVNYIP